MVLQEDLAVESFMVSSFGTFVMRLCQGLLSVRSAQTWAVLACGWALAGGERQTITTYLRLTGATRVKHFLPFLCLPGRGPVPSAVEPVGTDYPPGGRLGAGGGLYRARSR